MALQTSKVPIERIVPAAYRIPTETPESDGTLSWNSTTLVTVTIEAGGKTGFGYTYADTATAVLIRDRLAGVLLAQDANAVPAFWRDMVAAIRNLGRPGICSMAISALDTALWDLKSKLHGLSLAVLLGRARDSVPVYGSGGFTNYSMDQLRHQLSGWLASGIRYAKIKVGRDANHDVIRVHEARRVLGTAADLFVDANGAYHCKQALQFAQQVADYGVTWFEEPVSSDDLAGLRLLRDRAPGGIAITAGEYGYDLAYFRRMLDAQAVDILQADATRCGGITGFLGVAALCQAYAVPLSTHCAPALHLPLCCAALPVLHLEYFHDHVRIEQMLFDGTATVRDGQLAPDLSRPGLGIVFKEQDAQCYRI